MGCRGFSTVIQRQRRDRGADVRTVTGKAWEDIDIGCQASNDKARVWIECAVPLYIYEDIAMTEMKKVSMNLTDEEIALIEKLRDSLKMSTKTGTIGQSLRIVDLIAENAKRGKNIAFVDKNGNVEAKLIIPGLSN